jgi:hypothetical protein
MPNNIVFKEVKNMQKEDIYQFLHHILGRQKKFGDEHAFRFRIYIKKKKEHLSEYPEVAGRRHMGPHAATTSIAAPSTEIPSNGTIQGNNRESPVSQPTHNLPEAAISTADNGTAAADTNLITGSKKPTNKRKNKKKSRKTLPNDDEIVPTAAIATAAEDSNSMDGYEPPKPRRSNRTSQPKVPKSDAIAIQEAQKFIQQKSKRRR